ncbi:MAG TPA: helix-turn-helix transcriptional regulator [Tepidisphaeraceae bacterium]|jgi:ribosome-binding protein aMBF1 (putative translation factor)
MPHATLKMGGKTFVLVPEREYRGMIAARAPMPDFPTANAEGNFPAVQTGRVSVAREIIRRRNAVGLSQKSLAAAAGIRVETLNRIEKARVTADTATIAKIDRALKRAER